MYTCIMLVASYFTIFSSIINAETDANCPLLYRCGELPPDSAQNLLSYSQQVALAMHYLSTKGFVHRDLAARNIFVTQENICKVDS